MAPRPEVVRVCGFRPLTALKAELSRGVEHEEQIDPEHEEMNGTLQHVGAALSESEDGDRENDEEEGDFRVFQAEDDLAPVKSPMANAAGIVSPMVARTDPRRMLTERCSWLFRADCTAERPSGARMSVATRQVRRASR